MRKARASIHGLRATDLQAFTPFHYRSFGQDLAICVPSLDANSGRKFRKSKLRSLACDIGGAIQGRELPLQSLRLGCLVASATSAVVVEHRGGQLSSGRLC